MKRVGGKWRDVRGKTKVEERRGEGKAERGGERMGEVARVGKGKKYEEGKEGEMEFEMEMKVQEKKKRRRKRKR